MYVDAHCHLADLRLEAELDRVLRAAESRGISLFVQGGFDPDDWQRQLELQRRYPNRLVTAFGLHPWWVAAHTDQELEEALVLLEKELPRAQALGELGLDQGRRVGPESYPRQLRAFRAQLEISQKISEKPLVLHIVRAHSLALGILKAIRVGGQYPGIIHSFSGSREIARQYLDLGFSLSISGGITRKGFETLRRAVSYIPRDRLILESDSPDQSPENWMGDLNEPISLFETAKAVGEIRGEDPDELLQASSINARRVFLGRIL